MEFYTNNYLVTCAPADHVICIWDTNTFRLIKTIKGKQESKKIFRLLVSMTKHFCHFTASSDIIALNMYKDEVITINSNNTITFSPLNDNVSMIFHIFFLLI